MESEEIVHLIERVMTGDPWHGPSLAGILAGVTPDLAARRPPGGAHGIWDLVRHMTGWAREVTARLGGRPAQEPDEGDWPAIGTLTPEAWRAAQDALFAAHVALMAAIRQAGPAVLSRPVVDFRENALGTGLSGYLTLHGIIHHTVYHAGQIALLKRMLA